MIPARPDQEVRRDGGTFCLWVPLVGTGHSATPGASWLVGAMTAGGVDSL